MLKLISIVHIVFNLFVCFFVFENCFVPRLFLDLAIILMVSNIGVMLYLTLYLPLIARINIPWDQYCPNMIPISTGLGLGCILFFILAYWPIFGLLSPIIVFLILMGLIFSTHFIPWPC